VTSKKNKKNMIMDLDLVMIANRNQDSSVDIAIRLGDGWLRIWAFILVWGKDFSFLKVSTPRLLSSVYWRPFPWG
jgi:hypothetical protein